MGTGPRLPDGFDLALTELTAGGEHRFLARAGSDVGEEVLAELQALPATRAELEAADAAVEKAASSQVRSIDAAHTHEVLERAFDDPHWEKVAARCLACGNCTMVCPTCFCTTVEDTSELDGSATARTQRWDSCFTMDHSYIHGGSVRPSESSRYRQWMTHKLSTWWDQFGTSGCVGCGRCITWCPVGIDITEEVAAIRGSEQG
jgi:ferredoxin